MHCSIDEMLSTRHCTLLRQTSVCRTSFFLEPRKDDLLEIVPNLTNILGKCLLIIDSVNDNLGKIVGDKITVLKIPDVDADFIAFAEALLKHAKAIFLTNREQYNVLRRKKIFHRLSTFKFPVPEPSFFIDLLLQRMEEANVDVSPFTTQAVAVLALMSNFNPGRYIKLLDNTLLQMELDEINETVNTPYVFNSLASSLNEDAMIVLVLAKCSGWRYVTEISDSLYELFSERIDVTRLGRKLTKMGLKHRDNNGSQYKIPPINFAERDQFSRKLLYAVNP